MTSLPFFRLVWTLQEVFLRQRELSMLSRTSHQSMLTVTSDSHSHQEQLDFWWVLNVCTNLVISGSDLLYYEIYDLIQNSGMLALTSQHKILLYTASCRRIPRRIADHIYGNMQVYGLNLGRCEEFDELLSYQIILSLMSGACRIFWRRYLSKSRTCGLTWSASPKATITIPLRNKKSDAR